MKRVKIIISGEVQGVFFRAFVREKAVELGVNGYVQNRKDGKIEAVFEGKEKDVDELIKLCRVGPVAAKISDVKVKEDKFLNEFSEFFVL
ncbi:MAG: acylphosphatase [Candidatus Nanoarchaeia archaeon]|nr:acylphosphatase [Candidatus Nanoarchaeia archaeon]